MKKLAVVILAALLLSGCVKAGQLTPAPADTESTASAAQPTGKVVSPLPSSLNLNDPGDCIVAVGFTEKTDAYMNGGRFEIRMDVYEQELFDLVDMAMLAPGDVLMICGQRVPVETITEENGAKLINGGWEAGGYTFFTNEDGVFFTVSANDQMDYQRVGEITLPVAQDFTLTDNSNLEEKVIYPGDLIVEAPQSDAVFQPAYTRAHIADGFLQSITVSYHP